MIKIMLSDVTYEVDMYGRVIVSQESHVQKMKNWDENAQIDVWVH